MASDSRELATPETSAVSTSEVDADEPSAAWGWHGSFPKGRIAGGVVTIILCAAFFVGPYQSHTQYLWLAGVILIVIAGIVASVINQRNAWRR